MEKNFEQIGCVFCGAANSSGDQQCGQCGRPLAVAAELLDQRVRGLVLKEFKGRGFWGLTYQAEDDYQKRFAVKLIANALYEAHSRDFDSESKIYACLPDHPCIARYTAAGETTLDLLGEQRSFYYIVSEWVDGITLKHWLAEGQFAPEELYWAACDMLAAVYAFEEKKLWHRDLHEENILVTDLSESQSEVLGRPIPRILKVVDIGSARFRAGINLKKITDLNYIGGHIAEGHKRLAARGHTFCKEDQYFLRQLPSFCASLMDEDRSRGFLSAKDALATMRSMWRESRYEPQRPVDTLLDAYGLINAMDIHSPRLIRDMFCDKFVYVRRLENMANHVYLIAGPRGCGKTMILRWLAFETKALSGTDTPSELMNKMDYIGLFRSARVDFGNLQLSVRRPAWIFNPVAVGLYFNALITSSMVDFMYWLDNQGVENVRTLQPIIDFIVERFGLRRSDLYSCRPRLAEVTLAVVEGAQNQPLATLSNSTPAYLNDLFRLCLGSIPCLREKQIVLLIDDVSWPRVPKEVMEALAPFLFCTGSTYKVRVSSHTDGIVTRDSAGEEYKVNRDFLQIDLGWEYYQRSDEYEALRDAFDDLMERRFRLARDQGFPGLEEVLGAGKELMYLGREIRRLRDGKTLKTLRYHGARTFVRLCSGDLSYLVDLLGVMERLHGDKDIPIGADTQNSCIRRYARHQLLLLRDMRTERVRSLYDTAMAFGVWSKGELVHKGREKLRLDIAVKDLSDEQSEAIRELLSCGLFIDGAYSNNSKGQQVRRLLFRRIYTPAFPTTVNNRDSTNMNAMQLTRFVQQPNDWLREMLCESGLTDPEQQALEMFDNGD